MEQQKEVNGFEFINEQTQPGQSTPDEKTTPSESQKAVTQESEKPSQPTQETEEEVEIPEKFRGQSLEETVKKIAKSYAELEKKSTQATQEAAHYRKMSEYLEGSLKFYQQQQTVPQTSPQEEDPDKLLDEFIKNPKQTIRKYTQDLVAPIYQQQVQQGWEQQRLAVRKKIGDKWADQLEPEIFNTMRQRSEYLNSPDGYFRAATEVLGKAYLDGVKEKPVVPSVEPPRPAPKALKNITGEAQRVAQLYGRKPEKIQEDMEKIVSGEFMPIGED